MIDFTTIQTFEVPEAILELKRESNELKNKNEILNHVIICGVALIITYQIWKIIEKEIMIKNKENPDEFKSKLHSYST